MIFWKLHLCSLRNGYLFDLKLGETYIQWHPSQQRCIAILRKYIGKWLFEAYYEKMHNFLKYFTALNYTFLKVKKFRFLKKKFWPPMGSRGVKKFKNTLKNSKNRLKWHFLTYIWTGKLERLIHKQVF